jgi:hypothetical protein
MRITFRANTPRNRVNESSALTVTAKVWDDSTDPWTAQVPTTLHYRLDDLTSNRQILDWTSITADDVSSIAITATQNAILDGCRDYETKQLTVQANRGLSTQSQNVFSYDVRNLAGQS